MPFQFDDSQLSHTIDNLSEDQLMRLATMYSESYIENYMHDINETIAIEAKDRIQAKIALTFVGGWSQDGSSSLMDSIYYYIDGDKITVASTKNYFEILNRGYESFDMKAAMMGKVVKMRLPGGAVIYRRVGDPQSPTVPNLNTHLLTRRGTMRQRYPTKNWIHPGYAGKHIYEQVEAEMSAWAQQYMEMRIGALLATIPDVPFHTTQEGLPLKQPRKQRSYYQQLFGYPVT